MATTTWTGATNTSWGATPGGANSNWDTGFTPTSADAVIIDANAPGNVVLNGTAVCASLDFTGFTGTFTATGHWVDVWGTAVAVIFTEAMTVIDTNVTVRNSATITSAGNRLNEITPSGTVTLADAAHVRVLAIGAGGTLAFGANTLHMSGGVGLGIELNGEGAVTYSAGAAITIDATELTSELVQIQGPLASGVWPPTTITGGISVSAAATFINVSGFESLSINSLPVSAGSFAIAITGNFTLADVLEQTPYSSVTVGGDLLVTTSEISSGVWAVTGAAAAHSCTITTADFSGGTQLDASDNCIDGGGNTNVSFVPAVAVTDVTSAKTNGTYKASEVIDIAVTFDSAVDVTGEPRILLDGR